MKKVISDSKNTVEINSVKESKVYITFYRNNFFKIGRRDCCGCCYYLQNLNNTLTNDELFRDFPVSFKEFISLLKQDYPDMVIYEFNSFNEFLLNHWNFHHHLNIRKELEFAAKSNNSINIFGETKYISNITRECCGAVSTTTYHFNDGNDQVTILD